MYNLNLTLSLVLFFFACAGEEDEDKPGRDFQSDDTASDDSGMETDTDDSATDTGTDDSGSIELEAGTFVFQDEEDVNNVLVGAWLPAYNLTYVHQRVMETNMECPAVEDVDADPTVITGGCEEYEVLSSQGSLTISPRLNFDESWQFANGLSTLTWDEFALESVEPDHIGLLAVDGLQYLTSEEDGELLLTMATLQSYGEQVRGENSDGEVLYDQFFGSSEPMSFSYDGYTIQNLSTLVGWHWADDTEASLEGSITVEGQGEVHIRGTVTPSQDYTYCDFPMDGTILLSGTALVTVVLDSNSPACECYTFTTSDGLSGEGCLGAQL